MSRLRLTALAALTVAVAAAVFFTFRPEADIAGAAFAQDTSEVDTSGVVDMTLGNPDADVTVIEYASFTCPHCARFHADVYPQLKADYIDEGKINFVYREVYFDRPGLWAGIVARCGGEDRYFGIADMIYDQQSEWARAETAEEIVGSLRRIGKTAGLTDADLDACLTDADNAQALYAAFVKNAEADGVESTPSFVINGELHRNMGYPELQEILDDALGE